MGAERTKASRTEGTRQKSSFGETSVYKSSLGFNVPRQPIFMTVPEAIKELKMGQAKGRRFLKEHGLVHHPGGRRRGSGRVIVADLVQIVRGRPSLEVGHRVRVRLPITDKF